MWARDDTGLGGLEQEFDDEMHGTPGHMLTAVDAKRHVMDSVENEPLPGENLVLTIDANIQYMAERALDAQMDKVKALHGTVVVQDPHTGQILALAISPRFNPNDSRHMEPGSLTNLAVSDVYEPGSTFKLVTYSTAIDAAGVQPDDMVDCQGGSMTMYGRTLHDDKDDHFGRVTVQYALEHSSDVGAAKMALKVGPETFYKYIKALDLATARASNCPARRAGCCSRPKQVGLDQHPVAGDRAGGGRDAGTACNHGEHNCEWRACICRRTSCCNRPTRPRATRGCSRRPSVPRTSFRRSCRRALTA